MVGPLCLPLCACGKIGGGCQLSGRAVILNPVVFCIAAARQKPRGIACPAVGIVPGHIHQIVSAVEPDIIPRVRFISIIAGDNPTRNLRLVAQKLKGIGISLTDRLSFHQRSVGVKGGRIVVRIAFCRSHVIFDTTTEGLLEVLQQLHCVAALLFPCLTIFPPHRSWIAFAGR